MNDFLADYGAAQRHAAALLNLRRFSEAEVVLRSALSSGTGPIVLWKQLVYALRPQGKIKDAQRILEMIVQTTPGDMSARFDLSEVLLLQGDFLRGWREYRFRYKLAHTTMIGRHVQMPRWEGQPIQGKTLLIHDEQGYGDTFQFLRMVAWARKRSGARVILEVNAECYPLAKRGGGYDEIIVKGQIPPAFDLHCEMMSLPLAMGITLDDLPGANPYLTPDSKRVEKWRKRLELLPHPQVGLVWAGRSTHANDARRSIALADMAPLAQEGITFVALQKGPAAVQAATPPKGMAIVSLSDEIQDFEDTAAILSLIDVLVSVDSSPIHLAGALGCATWAMLPFVPDWRWLLERHDTPWYPKMRLYRQQLPDQWGPVLDTVSKDLSQFKC